MELVNVMKRRYKTCHPASALDGSPYSLDVIDTLMGFICQSLAALVCRKAVDATVEMGDACLKPSETQQSKPFFLFTHRDALSRV